MSSSSLALDPEDDPEGREREEGDLQAAAQHLTQDFLSQVIQEEGAGQQGSTPGGVSDQGVAPQTETTVLPLSSILGKLPSTASLGFQDAFQTFDKSEPSQNPEGERNT